MNIQLSAGRFFGAVGKRAAVGLAGASLALAATVGVGAAAPTVASADSAGPSYFLYSSRTGASGPCANRVGSYLGVRGLGGDYFYKYGGYQGSYWVGDTYYEVYTEDGFNTAYAYNGCYGNYPAVGYYGANKRVLRYEYVRECTPDFLSCWGNHYEYGSWHDESWS